MSYGIDKWPTQPQDWNTARGEVKAGPSILPSELAGDFEPFHRSAHEISASVGGIATEANGIGIE